MKLKFIRAIVNITILITKAFIVHTHAYKQACGGGGGGGEEKPPDRTRERNQTRKEPRAHLGDTRSCDYRTTLFYNLVQVVLCCTAHN